MLLFPAGIPSPTSGTMSIGSLRLTAYGMMIAIGVIAAASLASRRLTRSGAGTPEAMGSMASSVFVGSVGFLIVDQRRRRNEHRLTVTESTSERIS